MKINGTSFLVTGGTGFIGSALVNALVSAGARVRCLDDDSRGRETRLLACANPVEIAKGDIRDPDAVRSAVAGVDCVCHLAYVNGTEFFYSEPEMVLDVAVRGMLNVLDSCRETGVRDLVLASSSEVYQTPPSVPTDETVPLSIPDVLNPRYSYGGGKIISELMAINYGRKHFDRVVIFRPHNVYGSDMGWEHVIPQFATRMQSLIRETPSGVLEFPIQGSGTETRSFIYIDDAVDAIVRVIESGEHMNVYNIGTPEEISVSELAAEVGRFFGRDIEVKPGKIQPGSTLRRCPDIAKLAALDFQPRVSLREGLQRTLNWYRAKSRQPAGITD